MDLKKFLQIFGAVAVVLTLVPLIAADYWWIRIFDYPHTQLTFLTLIAVIAYCLRFDIKWLKDYIFMGVMIACLVFQFLKIYPYTPLHSYEVLNYTTYSTKTDLRLFTSNVLQKNKDHQKLLIEIFQKDPDIIILCEADTIWRNAIAPKISKEYKYRVEEPLSNTYGMLLYSKYKLVNPKVNYLVDDEIPSIHTQFILPSKDTIQLYAIHPTPPMPQHNPSSSDRDTEMMMVAKMSVNSKFPVVVMGDFNDVAWSNTTKLFKEVGELLDVRIGRGLFNTFNARNFLFRWPLDHIFISEEFRVINVKRGNDINSDHFPTYVHLNFEPSGAAQQKSDPPTPSQLKSANEQMSSFKKT
ncbi:MAG: endonuclease/exonuclease/phosphatase family protein [Leeuwenhoekiella sp.]